jgi:hypothetical protein
MGYDVVSLPLDSAMILQSAPISSSTEFCFRGFSHLSERANKIKRVYFGRQITHLGSTDTKADRRQQQARLNQRRRQHYVHEARKPEYSINSTCPEMKALSLKAEGGSDVRYAADSGAKLTSREVRGQSRLSQPVQATTWCPL